MTAVQTTRARSNGEIAREQGRPRDRRVITCAHLLAAGRLDTQKRRELAEQWGLKAKSIDQMASEAGTYLRLIGEREAMLEYCVAKLSEWIDDGDRDRVPALKLLAEVKGLLERNATTAVQVNIGTSDELGLAARAIARPSDRALLYAALIAGGHSAEALAALNSG